ncbi:hypothetical protein KC19_8G178700, partial [Ceratodon purpureus]
TSQSSSKPPNRLLETTSAHHASILRCNIGSSNAKPPHCNPRLLPRALPPSTLPRFHRGSSHKSPNLLIHNPNQLRDNANSSNATKPRQLQPPLQPPLPRAPSPPLLTRSNRRSSHTPPSSVASNLQHNLALQTQLPTSTPTPATPLHSPTSPSRNTDPIPTRIVS